MHALRFSPRTLALVPALVFAATSCSKGMSGTTSEAVVATPTGGYEVETFTTTATVVAIDSAKRKLTLQTPDGKKTSFKADPQMVNFPQIRVGDQVNATVTEEVVVALWRTGTTPQSRSHIARAASAAESVDWQALTSFVITSETFMEPP